MAKLKTRTQPASPEKKTVSNPEASWQWALWLIFLLNSLFFIPQCLDRYLAPRFLLLSLILLWAGWQWRRDFKLAGRWQLYGFDWLMLGWYGFNLVSVSWAYSFSEGIFYAQKVLLSMGVYWMMREGQEHKGEVLRATLRKVFMVLGFAQCGILLIQVGFAIAEHGLDNEALYDYATAIAGAKNLAADTLFLVLVFNIVLLDFSQNILKQLLGPSLLLLFIVLLQTRTVYLAVAAGALLYFPVRAVLEPAFRPVFWRYVLPAGVLAGGLLAALVLMKGQGNSLAERLNPMTYMESISANERRFVWYKTDVLNEDHFWLGVGNGSWKILFPSNNIQGGYRLQEQNIIFTRAHNDYLEVRAEMGILGAAIFVLLFVLAAFSGLWALRRVTDARTRHEILALLAGLLGYCIIQYLDFPRERIELQVMLAALLAWLAVHAAPWWRQLPGTARAGVFPALLGVLLLANVVIGWARVTGEIHMVRGLKAAAANQPAVMMREVGKAANTFYEYDDVVRPVPYHLGKVLLQSGRYEEGFAAMAKAYRLNPWSIAVLNDYAFGLAEKQRYQEAIPLLEKSIFINPKFDEGKLNLAYCYLQMGEYNRSLEWVQKVDTVPNPQNDGDRYKNKFMKEKQAEFLKTIEEKMK